MFTLVGGGMKTLANSGRPMASVLPSQARWVKDEVSKFEPKSNTVLTKNGDTIEYKYLLVAVGLKLDYHKVIYSQCI
jgi:eukaryotic sulfide quinone oxidoreductase